MSTDTDADETDAQDDDFDPSDYPEQPGDGVPAYVEVRVQGEVVRATTSSDILTATDVPAHVLGGLHGWEERDDYRGEAQYALDKERPDRFPTITVPKRDIEHLLRAVERDGGYPADLDATEDLRAIVLGDERDDE